LSSYAGIQTTVRKRQGWRERKSERGIKAVQVYIKLNWGN